MYMFSYFFIGVYFTLFIYHVLIFFSRNKEKKYFFYSFLLLTFSLVLSAKLFSIYSFQINSFHFQDITFRLISNSLCILAIFLFTKETFSLKKVFKLLLVFYIICIFFPLMSGVIYAHIFKDYFISNVIFMVPAIIFGITYWIVLGISVFKQKRYKNYHDMYIFIGILCFYLFYTLYPIFVMLKIGFLTQLIIMNAGFLIVTIVIGFSLTYTFSSEYNDLKILKKDLEEKVHERTYELEKANIEINENNNHIKNFFVNLMHDIKTPLTLIRNYIEKRLTRSPNNDELKIVESNLKKLEKEITDYMDVEKIERGHFIYNHDQIVDFSNEINEKIKLFQEKSSKKNIKLNCNIDENVFVKIDPRALDRLVNNLLDNAFKYTNELGSIDVSLIIKNDIAEFKISDNGIGISEKQLDNIFKPFYQISNNCKKIRGVGLGLSIIKKIIDEVKGNIKVKSKLGEGTSFIISLNREERPVHYNAEKNIKVKNKIDDIIFKEENYDEAKSSILIVEDSKDLLAYLQMELYEIYNVYLARNGKEALEKIKNIPKIPDLILSDIMMDVMDGYTFRDTLLRDEIYRTIPFIFITAKTGTADKKKAYDMMPVDYITKPFSIHDLISKIKSIIDLKDTLQKKSLEDFENKIINLIRSDSFLETQIKSFKFKCYELGLSKREKEIIKLIVEGKENKEIASILNLSLGTIKVFTNKIYKKCNVGNRIELLNYFNKPI